MNGLELIKHTAGGGEMTASGTGTVSLVKNGKIEFTDATKISVDDCFSGEYDNYLIVLSASSTSNPYINMRLRAGTDNQTANSYVAQRLLADAGNVTGQRYTNDYAFAGAGGRAVNNSGSHILVYGPFIDNQPTAARTTTVSDQSDSQIYDMAWTHNQSKSYDGMTIYPNTDNISGSLTIYGFTKGITP